MFRLAIFDDVPRQDFSPRQRHTLKEFAVGPSFVPIGFIHVDGL